LSFDVPDGLTDRSVIVLTDESKDGGVGLSLAVDVLPQPTTAALATYVDDVVREAGARLRSLRVATRETREVGGREALVLSQTASVEAGHQVAQVQAFVREGTAVTVVTVSCDADDAAHAHHVMDGVVGSIKRLST
jgi:hypothetical protein